jgi:hypothetical protein
MLSALADNSRTDKNTAHSYLDLYQSLLAPKKHSAKIVLEVGIHRGGSTKLWYDFFPNATVHALDILDSNEIPDDLKNKDRIVLHTSTNAYDETFFKKTFLDKNIKCDFMLDDGPHTLESMKEFIRLYSQLMTDDGILIIEDVQSIEWLPQLTEIVPEHLKKYIKTYDLRNNKGRYDDIVFTINKQIEQPNLTSISILIVSSFDTLCLECNKITRKQSKQYGFPVMFLFNGKLPEGYQLQSDEHILLTDSTDPQPYMFLKFKYALQYIFNTGQNPDYILRCNATTFINFKGLANLFFRLPREKLMAGPFIFATGNPDIDVYCQGTNMIFSNDVARHLAFDDNMNHSAVKQFADDIAIDILTRNYAFKQDLTLFTSRYVHFNTVPKIYDLFIDPTHVFYRVKNNCTQRTEVDLEIWKMLHYLFDVIHFRNDYILWGQNQYNKMPI